MGCIFQIVGNMTLPEFLNTVFGLKVNDRTFCIWYSRYGYFMIGYEVVGSAGMAVYRVLYLKVNNSLF